MTNCIHEYYNDENVSIFDEKEDGSFIARKVSGSVKSFWSSVRSVFLPEGYPNSVSNDYIYYQAWDTIQAFASSISGSLATSAVLEGVGVGDETATPLAASITWIFRDGTGMIGRILFAARFGTQLDYDCKKWRLFADILNDIAMLIEILTPRFGKEWTLPVLCVASVSRSLVGVAGGATKAAVAQHQAKEGNMADLAAKDGSQETMVNLLALVVNLTILPWLAQYKGLIFPLFLVMTCLHIFANYKAVTSLELCSLNYGRLTVILDNFNKTGNILSVPAANKLESLSFSLRRSRIRLGVSLKSSVVPVLPSIVTTLSKYDSVQTFQFQHKNVIYIFVNKEATNRDILKSFIDAWFSLHSEKEMIGKDTLELISEAGWNIDQRALHTEGYTFKLLNQSDKKND